MQKSVMAPHPSCNRVSWSRFSGIRFPRIFRPHALRVSNPIPPRVYLRAQGFCLPLSYLGWSSGSPIRNGYFKSINIQSLHAYFDVEMSLDSRTKTLEIHICGGSGPLDEFNPFLVTRQKWASELLFLLNEHPLSLSQISSALKSGRTETARLLEDLTRIQAVKEQSGIYSVAFSISTRDDIFILKNATRPIAQKLSASIAFHKKEMDLSAKNLSSFDQVGKDKLLFAALGCFVLDWLGLKLLQEEGVLVERKQQPGNRNYLLFAREQVKPSEVGRLYGKMYWGSRSDDLGDWVFTSFGDHNGIRYAFPDIVWALRSLPKSAQTFHETPSWMSKKMCALFDLISTRLLKDVGQLLVRLNEEGPVSVMDLKKNGEMARTLDAVRLLEDMNYIINEKRIFRLNYPVFEARDKNIIEQLGQLVSPMITKVMRQNLTKLQKALEHTSPIRNNIEFDEVLNEAWHWIFAQTNKILSEKRIMYDPPKRRLGEARYIAWLSQFHYFFP